MHELDKWHEDTSEVIKKTLTSLAEGVTGLTAADRKDLALSVGHIFQSLRKGQFLSQFGKEWNFYREEGRIKDDYLETEQHRSCFQELLDFLDNDSPDETRFEVMKKVFLVTATEMASDRNSLMPYQFLRICRGMSSGEVLVLNATYTIAKSKNVPNFTAATQWLEAVARQSKLIHADLVEIYEEELIKKKLLSRRLHPDKSGITAGQNFRLTDLGLELCEFISSYDSPPKEIQHMASSD